MAFGLSGVNQGTNGAMFLVTQGLSGCTLVAGKQCLFRLFMTTQQLALVDTVTFSASSPSFNQSDTTFTSKAALILEQNAPNGPSVGLIVPGFAFARAGNYTVTLSAQDAKSAVLQYTSFDLTFLPTKDLRLLVAFLIHTGVFGPTTAWYADIQRSMLRLGSMFPVRDGVQNHLNGNTSNGLRYSIGTPCDGYVAGYYDCVYGQTQQINASLGDHVDVTVEFRPGLYAPDWNPPGDPNPGGNSGRPPAPYTTLRRASCVAGRWNGIEMTAGCVAQEIGHNFGLEPPGSPHYQDPNDPGHSKDPFVADPYAYDFVNNRLYNHQLGDTMNNTGGGAWQGVDAVVFNAYDWEYLRNGFMALDSTGSESGAIGEQGISDINIGVYGGSTSGVGVYGESSKSGYNFGVVGKGPNAGVAAFNSNNNNAAYLASACCGAWLTGDVHVAGTLSKTGGQFLIDHPLDPANQYLSHAFVESSEMKNVYDGIAVLDANGEAVVELPEWFETLNTDFRYQLTLIGAPGPAPYIAQEISHRHFKIAGGVPTMRVSWQVTGVRQDAWAKAHPLEVEQEKSPDECCTSSTRSFTMLQKRKVSSAYVTRCNRCQPC